MIIDMWNRCQNALMGRGLSSENPAEMRRRYKAQRQRIGKRALVGCIRNISITREDQNDDFVDLTYLDGRVIRLRRRVEGISGLTFHTCDHPLSKLLSIVIFDPKDHDRIKESNLIVGNAIDILPGNYWANDPILDPVFLSL